MKLAGPQYRSVYGAVAPRSRAYLYQILEASCAQSKSEAQSRLIVTKGSCNRAECKYYNCIMSSATKMA